MRVDDDVRSILQAGAFAHGSVNRTEISNHFTS